MKARTIVLLVLTLTFSQLLIAQNVNKSSLFTKSEFGFYGGVITSNSSNPGAVANFDFKTDLTTNLNLKLSATYSKMDVDYFKNVKRSGSSEIQGDEYFYATEYDIDGRNYQSIPISIGLQYILHESLLSPYIIAEAGINFIDAKATIKNSRTWNYSSLQEIPEEYKQPYSVEPLPLSSFRYGLGIGAMYPLSSVFNLDLRYLYNFDTEIVNTHQVLVGFVF